MSPRRYSCVFLALVFVASLATVASAVPPYPVRTPQVAVSGTALQDYLNGLGESINVLTDQLAAQTYIPSVSGNSAITLMIELGKDPTGTALGIYDPMRPDPDLYEVFPGNAATHWSAMVSFLMSGDIVVNLFNASGVLQGNTVYTNVNLGTVGFYLAGRGGTVLLRGRAQRGRRAGAHVRGNRTERRRLLGLLGGPAERRRRGHGLR